MADLDADIWVCGECRSINNFRAKQCYRCRTPRDVAAVDPNQIEGTGHGRLREIALPQFKSTRWAAFLASTFLIMVAVTQVVATVSDAILFGRVLRDPDQLNDPVFYQSVESVVAGTAAIATLVVALLALIAWSFWLSRAVMAMPALGLGYPAANGLMAFVENFLPGLNLFRVPAIVRDVMRRLDPESLRGEALIFAAWIGLLGGYLVPRLGAYLGLLGSGTLEEIVRETLLVQAIATALVVVGATFLVALIWWIERRIARRRAAQLEGEPPAVSSAPETLAVEAEVAAPIATYRVEEDPEFVAGPEGAAGGPEPEVAASGMVPTPGTPAPGDPRLGGAAGSAASALADPSGATGSVAPIAEEGATGPPGTIASRAASGVFTNRSITAATGAASTPPEAAAAGTTLEATPSGEARAAEAPAANAPMGEAPTIPEASPTERAIEQAPPPAEDSEVPRDESSSASESQVEVDRAVASEQSAAPVEPSPAEAEAPEIVPEAPGGAVTGPQLHLRVESVSSMIATMDGESEPITLDELRVAAEALARANGSAVIASAGTSFGALSLAEQAFEVLTDAGVATTVEE